MKSLDLIRHAQLGNLPPSDFQQSVTTSNRYRTYSTACRHRRRAGIYPLLGREEWSCEGSLVYEANHVSLLHRTSHSEKFITVSELRAASRPTAFVSLIKSLSFLELGKVRLSAPATSGFIPLLSGTHDRDNRNWRIIETPSTG